MTKARTSENNSDLPSPLFAVQQPVMHGGKMVVVGGLAVERTMAEGEDPSWAWWYLIQDSTDTTDKLFHLSRYVWAPESELTSLEKYRDQLDEMSKKR